MPFYEYICQACSNEFELLRRFSDDDNEVTCPNCERVGTSERTVSVPMQARVPGASGAGKQSHLPR